jgi:uncharacterized membrane protein YraQ (UPF0718 family)
MHYADPKSILWGCVLRTMEAAADAAPTLLCGLLIAGIVRRLLGADGTRRLFGGHGGRGLLRAWVMGMLLPVCSLGVIPVLRELRRAGLRGGTILAFALAAPLFNPLSLLYGLTLSRPAVILLFAACSLVVVTVVGFLWDRFFPDKAAGEPPAPPVEHGWRRMAAIGLVATRESVGPTLGYCLLGITGMALLSAALPHGALQRAMQHENPWAPLSMSAAALPTYVTPMNAMSQIGSMFQHGNSPGAALVLLAVGAGLNLGVLMWGVQSYGLRRTGLWLAAVLTVVLGLAYAVEHPLYPADIQPADHTHAFDGYTCPFVSSGGNAHYVWWKFRDGLEPHETVGLVALAAVMAVGIGLRFADPRGRTEAWLETRRAADTSREASLWHRPLSPASLGLAALAVLVTLSLLGCYVYYPPVDQVLEDMQVVQAEALSSALAGESKESLRALAQWEALTRKLQVGAFLRQGSLDDYRRFKAEILRDKLELLEHAVADGDPPDEVRERVNAALRAQRRCSRAYRAELPTAVAQP